MKLYGSVTSPYVRRLRILLAGGDFTKLDYDFVAVNIFGEERNELKKINPTLKIPMFEDTGREDVPALLDSNIIFEYLQPHVNHPSLDWAQKNDLALINSANDALVNMMIMTRSKVNVNEDKLYFNIQRERCETTFEYFESKLKAGDLKTWNYITISLLVLVEWASFRNLFDFSRFGHLLDFVEQHQTKTGVKETAPE